MMIKRLFILLFFFSTIILPILADAKPLNDYEVIDLLRNGFVVSTKADEAQVKKQLGPPTQTKSEQISNPYSEVKNEVTHYIYPGLEIIFYENKNPQNPWKHIVQIIVSSKQHKLKYELIVGMNLTDVENMFKGRDRQTWTSNGFNYYSFSMTGSVHDQINFAVRNNIVQQIIWSDWPR